MGIIGNHVKALNLSPNTELNVRGYPSLVGGGLLNNGRNTSNKFSDQITKHGYKHTVNSLWIQR